MSISGEQVMEASLDELFAIAEQKSRQIRVSITQHEASVENVKAANLPKQREKMAQLDVEKNRLGRYQIERKK